MRRLMENDERHGAERQQPRHYERDSSYSDVLVTYAPAFADATDPLEVDSWLRTTEYKFGLLHYTEYEKTMYAVQLEHVGLPTSPPYLLITMFHGVNSIPPSMHITYLWVCSIAS
jgi:hypothetical protein